MPDEDAIYAEVGRRIKEGREKARMSQEKLAKLVSLSRTSISNIEKGRQRLLVHKLIEVALALGVRPGRLLPPLDAPGNLDEILKQLPQDEKTWIEATVRSNAKEG